MSDHRWCCNGNAEECRLCTDPNPPYPFLCPGHDDTPENRAALATPLSAPADRAVLRDRIAQALHAQLPGCTHDGHGDDCRALADAVLAVLPASATADVRKLVKRLVAHAQGFQDVLDEGDSGAWGKTVGADIEELRVAVADRPARVDRAAVLREAADAIVADNDRQMWATKPGHHWAADLLRRMADEAQQAGEGR